MPRPKITKDMIEYAQKRGWNRAQTAKNYGMHHTSINAACERFGIDLSLQKVQSAPLTYKQKIWQDSIPDSTPTDKVRWSASKSAVNRALAKLEERKKLMVSAKDPIAKHVG